MTSPGKWCGGARSPSPPKGIDWGDSDGICSAGGGGKEQESTTLWIPCTNSVTVLNVPSTGRSIKNKEVEAAPSIKVSAATRTRKAKFSAQVKNDRAPWLEPIVQKEYGCTTAGPVARIFSPFSYLRDDVIGIESSKWGLL